MIRLFVLFISIATSTTLHGQPYTPQATAPNQSIAGGWRKTQSGWEHTSNWDLATITMVRAGAEKQPETPDGLVDRVGRLNPASVAATMFAASVVLLTRRSPSQNT